MLCSNEIQKSNAGTMMSLIEKASNSSVSSGVVLIAFLNSGDISINAWIIASVQILGRTKMK